MIHVYDAIKLSSRERTPDGFVRGKAAVTKVGVLEYGGDELGMGNADTVIRVKQTAESVFHADTLSSLRNAALTIGHPPGGVNPLNFRSLSVGSVGNPTKLDGDRVGADIMFGDTQAIQMLENEGWEELSIGKHFTLQEAGDDHPDADFITIGPIAVNHVAMVEKGRAGSDVRVFDRRRIQERGNDTMDTSTLAAITAAVNAGLAGANPNASQDNTALATKAVTDALAPVLEKITARQDAADEAARVVKQKEVNDALKEKYRKDMAAADKAGYDRGIKEGQIRAEALAFIDPAMHAQFAGKPTKDLLVAATQDVAPGGNALNEETLHGMLLAKRNMAMGGMPSSPGVAPPAAGVPGGAGNWSPWGPTAFAQPNGFQQPMTHDQARQLRQSEYEAMIDGITNGTHDYNGNPISPKS